MAEAHTWGLWTPIALEDEVQSRTLSWDVLTSPWPGSPVCLMDSCLPSPELSAQTERFPAFPRCPSLWTVPFPSVPLFPYSVREVCLLKRSLLQVSAPFLLSPCPPPIPRKQWVSIVCVYTCLVVYSLLSHPNYSTGTSLAVQWLRLGLPTQGMRVWSLVRELRSRMPRGHKIKT